MIFTPFINGSVSVTAINRINEKVVMKSHTKIWIRREMKSENKRKERREEEEEKKYFMRNTHKQVI